MHLAKFITFSLLAPFLISCQSWPESIQVPWNSAPAAPVAADLVRGNAPESSAPLANIESPYVEQDPINAITEAIAAYVAETIRSPDRPARSSPDSATGDAVTIDLWERIRRGFKLEHHLDKQRVQAELNWYRRHPAYLDRVAVRAERHLFHIVEAIEERALPMEIALLPIVESAFDPFAYSHGRAAGLWQFIPGTARYYGLQIDWWYDGRRDVPAATRAAIDYLAHLHQSLDEDWLLALAAYNAGQGNIRKAVRHNRNAGKPDDFWSLQLLSETRVYVPRLLAISALIAEPHKYDIDLVSVPNRPRWEAVDIGSQLDLAKAASLADMTMEELYLLNPAFNRWSTHPDGPHRLLIPVQSAGMFQDRLDALPAHERLAWRRHKIRSGETLGLIAQRHHTSVDAIRIANNLRGHIIKAGDALLIPVATQSQDAYSLSKEGRLERNRQSLEDKFGAAPTRYKVKPGDSLWEIGQQFRVPVRTLAKWNGMAPTDILKPDTELVLFLESARQVSPAPEQNEVIRKVHYRVRSGESLSLIADKFNLSVANINKWNDGLAQRKYIHPGDLLTLFVDVTSFQ